MKYPGSFKNSDSLSRRKCHFLFFKGALLERSLLIASQNFINSGEEEEDDEESKYYF